LTLKGPSPGGSIRTAAADGVPDSGTPTARKLDKSVGGSKKNSEENSEK
jgi:hypothetical protein